MKCHDLHGNALPRVVEQMHWISSLLMQLFSGLSICWFTVSRYRRTCLGLTHINRLHSQLCFLHGKPAAPSQKPILLMNNVSPGAPAFYKVFLLLLFIFCCVAVT